jgi:hypothetical protein
MTREQKDLLLKDLCARLYTCNCINGTALTVALADEQPLEANQWLISNYDCYKGKFIVSNIVYASDVEQLVDIDNIRPYLFPLSSMTEEQEKDIFHNGKFYIDHHNSICRFPTNEDDYDFVTVEDCLEIFNKLNKYHFDYRGLIPMGLALDATGLNIY